MTDNTKKKVTITVRNEPIEEIESFTYLGSNMSKAGDSKEDTRIRLRKGRQVLSQLYIVLLCMEIQAVLQRDQIADLLKLCCTCHPLWVRVLEDDTERLILVKWLPMKNQWDLLA